MNPPTTVADVRAAIAEAVEEGWLRSETADRMYAILDGVAEGQA